MSLAEFEGAPTAKRHPYYQDSMFSTAAPEWSTGEVLLASAYRALLLGVSESDVDLESVDAIPSSISSEFGDSQLWSRLLGEEGGIAVPIRKGQRNPLAARQLMPIVPSVGRVAGVLGKKGRNRWNPGSLLFQAIGAGSGKSEGESLLVALKTCLSVTTDDDIFARLLEGAMQSAMQRMAVPLGGPPSLELKEGHTWAYRSKSVASAVLTPAERFCQDIPSVLSLKRQLTRRQWTVLVEAQLRLALSMHVLWTCSANVQLWDLVLEVTAGNQPPGPSLVERSIWLAHMHGGGFLELGANGDSSIRRLIERYAFARVGLNLLRPALASLPKSPTAGRSRPPRPGLA